MGSLLILEGLGEMPPGVRISCLAPFLSFCREEEGGGTTPRAVVRAMQAKIRQRPERALKLFHRLAGLEWEEAQELPYAVEELDWGLEKLATVDLGRLEDGRGGTGLVEGYAGARDPLTDVEALQSRWPSCKVVVPCSHNYRELLTILARAAER